MNPLQEKFQKLCAVVMVMAAILLAVICVQTVFTIDAEAQTYANSPVPQSWVDRTGTNGFTLNSSAVPVVLHSGTNYTAITTNLAFTQNGVTNQLRIVNGIITGVLD